MYEGGNDDEVGIQSKRSSKNSSINKRERKISKDSIDNLNKSLGGDQASISSKKKKKK